MSHWMVRAAQRAGIDGADALTFPSGVAVDEVWKSASQQLGIELPDLAAAVADAYSMSVADFDTAIPTAAKLLPASVARKYGVFPLLDADRYLVVATSNPFDPNADQEIGFASGRTAKFHIAPPSTIDALIDETYAPEKAAASMLSQIDQQFSHAADVSLAEDETPESVSEEETGAGPIVRLANIILNEAVQRGASDIHIQPLGGKGVVRFRMDGVLHNGMQLPLPVMTRVVSRIKIMAKLDITDRLRPQDGRAKIHVEGRKYDLRVSTVPTRQSEKAVIRVLDTQGSGTLGETGIVQDELERIRRALVHRDGIVVVTGPTGSGKTTTMYGALQEIATDDINIMTVEDPVEYELPKLTQIQVEHKQGMTFASALRAILRQDPDVIFVGEIRDAETAEIAAQASLTGHLVLATLHTNDAVGAIRRFIDLGLDTGTVAETLRGALAQRLIRKLCDDCATDVDGVMTEAEQGLKAQYGLTPPRRAVGCDKCMGSGYAGRLPITEFMTPTPELVALMLAGAPPHDLQKQAEADGMVTLLEAALRRVEAGETTLEEVERVVGGGDEDRSESPQPAAAKATGRAAGTPFAAPASTAGEAAFTQPIGVAATAVAEELAPKPAPRPTTYGLPNTAAASAPAVAEGEGPRVLLVDDDGTTRSIARALIEKHLGYAVSESPDGADALLRFAKGEQFDLMLLDLDMPVLGGREVLRSVRQSMATATMPVVVLTGTPDPDAEIELMEMGADDYLRKPIDPARLQTRLKAALRRAMG